jgi:hypothetical protein
MIDQARLSLSDSNSHLGTTLPGNISSQKQVAGEKFAAKRCATVGGNAQAAT